MGKELSLQLEGFLALAGALTAYIICSSQQPCRKDPTEPIPLESRWSSW